jgi:hypothetical protein
MIQGRAPGVLINIMILSISRRCFTSFCLACAALLPIRTARAEEKAGIAWQPWSDGVFQEAMAEHKLVLLDLEAVWCHWCHVMDEMTYADPRVIALVREKYIAVRVDQDARPDLANRYEDYGWPATVLYKWDGSELAKRRGYIPPKPMVSMLQAFVDDPTPGPSVEQEAAPAPAADAALSKDQAGAMRGGFIDAYDARRGGWGGVQKFLDWDALEYCLTEGAAGDAPMEKMARQTLTAGLKLVDPVWGGVDQYSTNGDWDHPHFEKIMPFQAESMRVFALAASLWREPQWLGPAEKIHGYLKTFLTSPEGAFYTSQDADPTPGEQGAKYFALDDAARRKQGVPRVDRHIYARENGLAITGLAALYAASGDAGALADARRAAEWVVAHRGLAGGGFRHDERDAAGPYLADTLEMGRAFLALYTVTGERQWLGRAESAADFIDARFRAPIGFATAATAASATLAPMPEADENVTLARFANMLAHATGRSAYQAMAGHAMRYLASSIVVKQQGYAVAGILLANGELNTEPAHVTVVGAKDDPAARALFGAALRGAPSYTRIEWYDRREGPLPNADVEYPTLPQAAAYLCANDACSSPVRAPEALERKLARVGQ